MRSTLRVCRCLRGSASGRRRCPLSHRLRRCPLVAFPLRLPGRPALCFELAGAFGFSGHLRLPQCSRPLDALPLQTGAPLPLALLLAHLGRRWRRGRRQTAGSSGGPRPHTILPHACKGRANRAFGDRDGAGHGQLWKGVLLDGCF